MKNLKKSLKQGKTILFDNEQFLARTQTDDFRIAECRFKHIYGFQIYFNGAYFAFKTFNAFEKKLNQLKEDFNLELNKLETGLYNNI